MTTSEPDLAKASALEDTGLAADIIASAGSLLLVWAAFLPWYGVKDDATQGGEPSVTFSGWEVPAPNYSRLAALLGLAAGVVALLCLLGRLKPANFTVPGTARARGSIVMTLGALALLLVVVKATQDELFPGFDMEQRYGFVPAVFGIALLIGGAVLTLMSAPSVTVPGEAPVNGQAVAAVVLGAIGIGGGLLSILAIIFGFAAKAQLDANLGAQRGRGLAMTGIVLGFVGIAGALLTLLVLVVL